ncbi:MAG: hypothetical protein LBC87_01445 [Fibromonadaceae bacterium]|nr:hypothetical protein [Fibromonadaceae bacterium]
MSKDASLFPIHFFNSEIFCEECAQLRKFKIFSQEKYDKNYGKSEIPPNKPLFCKCDECENTVIYATNEFAELQEEPTFGFCKIWGMGNLETGDNVFHPEIGICNVDGINRVHDALPQIVLKQQNGEKIEVPAVEGTENKSTEFYRLFPQDAENARIGDRIYNTETKIIGKVIGLEFGEEQKIVIEFENKEIEKCPCKSSESYLTDDFLEHNAKWRCKDFDFSLSMQITSSSKVLSVSCRVSNLSSICELEKIISSIPQIRCFIMHFVVAKSEMSSSDIYKELVKNCIYLCCCLVEFKNQEIHIAGFYYAKDTQQKIYRVLSKFPIKKVILDIKMRSDIKVIRTINESERFIRISKIGKIVHIDGWVATEKEKDSVKWRTFFSTFSFNIENHLLVLG